MKKTIKILIVLLLLTGINQSEGAVPRLGVPKFQSSSKGIDSGYLDLITDNFINTLAGSKSIAVLERSRLDVIASEQKLNLSGLVDTAYAVEIGRLAGCQYMIVGSVYVQESANIAVRVVDVKTGEIYLSMSETSSSSNISSMITAASLLGNRVREEIAEEYAYVSNVKGKTINISRGSKDGVHRGDLYRIYADGTEIFDSEGNSLGHNIIDIAIVRIKDARPNFSTAEIVKNGGRIEDVKRNSKAENISEEYAQELISSGVFAVKRPSSKPVAKKKPKPDVKKTETPKPVEQEDAETLFQKAKSYYEKQNYKESVKYLRKAADKGHVSAQNTLGVMYDKGYGVKQDYGEAVKWYRLAAEQDYDVAQCNLGFMYDNGHGVKQNYREAMRLYRLAADKGFVPAQYNMGLMYALGHGVKQDYGEALRLFRLTADKGLAQAQNNLGFMYENGYGVKQDKAEAIKWYRKAVEGGYEMAKQNLKRLGVN